METLTPLADLHRHLDGSLRPSTVAALAAELGREVPAALAFTPHMGLAAALERFAFTLSLLQSAAAVRRVASEICADAAAEGVTTLEIRFAPQLHCGAPLEAIIDAALEGIAASGVPAGLILCALYGEPLSVAEALVDAAETRPGVVGLDLAGGPAPHHGYGMRDLAPAFRRAKDIGLGRTVHAGEGRPAGEILVAIEELHAQRIGHGTTLLDDPLLTELIIARGIVIEACPTSNHHTGVITAPSAHPLPRWLADGVRATIATDNTLLSAVDAPEEHRRARGIPGMDDVLLRRAIAHGHAAAFRRT